jgi:hypothetical protein
VGATVSSSLVSQILRVLPGPVLGVLDAWSQRVARRRWEQRQRKWLQRKLAGAGEAPASYHRKPWRD